MSEQVPERNYLVGAALHRTVGWCPASLSHPQEISEKHRQVDGPTRAVVTQFLAIKTHLFADMINRQLKN